MFPVWEAELVVEHVAGAEHQFHQGIDGEAIELAAHQVADARLGNLQVLRGRGLVPAIGTDELDQGDPELAFEGLLVELGRIGREQGVDVLSLHSGYLSSFNWSLGRGAARANEGFRCLHQLRMAKVDGESGTSCVETGNYSGTCMCNTMGFIERAKHRVNPESFSRKALQKMPAQKPVQAVSELRNTAAGDSSSSPAVPPPGARAGIAPLPATRHCVKLAVMCAGGLAARVLAAQP